MNVKLVILLSTIFNCPFLYCPLVSHNRRWIIRLEQFRVLPFDGNKEVIVGIFREIELPGRDDLCFASGRAGSLSPSGPVFTVRVISTACRTTRGGVVMMNSTRPAVGILTWSTRHFPACQPFSRGGALSGALPPNSVQFPSDVPCRSTTDDVHSSIVLDLRSILAAAPPLADYVGRDRESLSPIVLLLSLSNADTCRGDRLHAHRVLPAEKEELGAAVPP